MQPKNLSFSDKFGIIPCSSTFFLEVDARISLKKTKSYFRGKTKSENVAFLKLLFSSKNRGIRPKRLQCPL